jgi:hypothetical protein
MGISRIDYYDEAKGLDLFDKRGVKQGFQLKNADKFSEQTEYKAVWQPIDNRIIKPVIINDDRLKNYVRHHKDIVFI